MGRDNQKKSNRLKRGLCDAIRRGSISAETICLLAFISLGVIVAATWIGGAVHDTMSLASENLGGNAPVGRDKAPSQNGSYSSDGQLASPTIGSSQSVSQNLTNFAMLLVIGFGSVAGYISVLRRRGRSRDSLDAKEGSTCELFASEEIFEKRHALAGILSKDWSLVSQNRLPVNLFMTVSIKSVLPSADTDSVRALMRKYSIRHVAVRSANGQLVGIVSDRDTHKKGDRVVQIMTKNPMSVHPSAPINSAISQMLSNRISCLPVVTDDALLGMLTTSDVLVAFQCLLAALSRVSQTSAKASAQQTQSARPPSYREVFARQTSN
jgi:CBS domain-containing protein